MTRESLQEQVDDWIRVGIASTKVFEVLIAFLTDLEMRIFSMFKGVDIFPTHLNLSISNLSSNNETSSHYPY